MSAVSRKYLAGLLVIAILVLMLPVSETHARTVSKAEAFGKAVRTAGKTIVKNGPAALRGAAKIGVGIIGTALLLKFLSGVIVELAGLSFNMSLGLALDNDNYSSSKIDAIDAGWKFSRDVVNIFFIFILLFIAIATILGIEPYGAKSLLARLIIIALLINFSLLATRGVIYISNALAVEIYNTQVNIADVPGEAGAIASILGLKFKKNLGEQVMNRFYLKQLYEKAPKPDSVSAVANELFGFGTIQLGAIVVALLAAFLLFVASFLFITRMAVLWLLMILAPFGFVFLILPATRSYAQQWWKKLIDQAIFAPAFLFLFFIALKVLDKLGDFTGKANDIKSTNEYLSLILVQITIAFILLFASLMVAKQLGIYGADGAIGMAKKGGAWTRAFAARNTIGRASAKLKESRLGQAITQRSPLAYKALNMGTKVGGFDEKVVKDRVNFLKSIKDDRLKAAQFAKMPLYMQNMAAEELSPRDLEALHNGASTPGERAAIERAISTLGHEKREKYYDERGKREAKLAPSDLQAKWGGIREEEVRRSALENMDKEKVQKLAQEFDKAGPAELRAFATELARIKPEKINDALSVVPWAATQFGKTITEAAERVDIDKVDSKRLIDPANAAVMTELVRQGKPTQIQKIVNKGDELSVTYREELMKLDPTLTEDVANIAASLRHLGNAGTANWIESVPGKRALKLT